MRFQNKFRTSDYGLKIMPLQPGKPKPYDKDANNMMLVSLPILDVRLS